MHGLAQNDIVTFSRRTRHNRLRVDWRSCRLVGCMALHAGTHEDVTVPDLFFFAFAKSIKAKRDPRFSKSPLK